MTDMTSTKDLAPDHWSRLNITLHWLIVVLISVQYFIGEWMVDFFDGGLDGKALDGSTVVFGYLHIVIGVSILIAALLRLWDRFTHGRPEHCKNEPNWAIKLAKLTHTALYFFLLTMPIVGLTAWLLGNEWLGDQHVLASSILLGIIALHIAGALTNHFWFKTDVLRNMLPGQGRARGKR